MADFASSQSTIIDRYVMGNVRGFTCEYLATTAAATDTVVTPLTLVLYGFVNPLSSANAQSFSELALSTIATAANRVFISHSTHAGDTSMRYTVFGR